MKNFDQAKYCSAMCYYLNHIKHELFFYRADNLRHFVDPIGALMSGYITDKRNGKYSGNYSEFKQSCFVSRNALAGKWSTKEIHKEHVVPIKVIGEVLLKKRNQSSVPLTCNEILEVLKYLLIPCLVTQDEKILLKQYDDKMPPGWSYGNDPWMRYQDPKISLFPDIFAISPPSWMLWMKGYGHAFNPPLVASQVTPKFAFSSIPSCGCSDSLGIGLSSGCITKELPADVL